MERDLDEVVTSQERLLALRGECFPSSVDVEAKALLRTHLEQVNRLLANRRCFETLRVSFREVIEQPFAQAQRMARFLGTSLDIESMVSAVDRTLYRNRAAGPVRDT
jgi:hypothetical protein